MKVTYSSDKVNPFGGICFIDNLISTSGVSRLIEEHLGTRRLATEYSYIDIIKYTKAYVQIIQQALNI